MLYQKYVNIKSNIFVKNAVNMTSLLLIYTHVLFIVESYTHKNGTQ